MGKRLKRNSMKALVRRVVCGLLAKNPHRFPTGAEVLRECPTLLPSKGRAYKLLNEIKGLPLETLVQLNDDDRAEIKAKKEALGITDEPKPKMKRRKKSATAARVAAPVPRILPGPQREHPSFQTLEASLRENLDDVEDFLDVIRRDARGGKVQVKAYVELVRLKRDMMTWIADSVIPDTGTPELVPMEAIIRRAEMRQADSA